MGKFDIDKIMEDFIHIKAVELYGGILYPIYLCKEKEIHPYDMDYECFYTQAFSDETVLGDVLVRKLNKQHEDLTDEDWDKIFDISTEREREEVAEELFNGSFGKEEIRMMVL